MFDIEPVAGGPVARIKVIGVGGAGGNAINNMKSANIFGIDFIAMNTDLQHLDASIADIKVQIGASLTKGLGAGANPEIGMQAAMEDKDLIASHLDGADMVFITAGMGGGTGTGATPVIAQVAREMNILSVAIVTKPFMYEGRKRAANADIGIRELRKYIDTLIVIPNDNIQRVVQKGVPIIKAFSVANDILRQAVQGISDIILVRGLVNVDFADVKTVMQRAGRAVIGMGTSKGENAAAQATKAAIHNNLLEDSSIEDARGILVNITGGNELPLDAVNEALSQVYESAHKDLNLIFGVVIAPELEDEIRVTVIATRFDEHEEMVESAAPSLLWQPPYTKSKLIGSKSFLNKNKGLAIDTSITEHFYSSDIPKTKTLNEIGLKKSESISHHKDDKPPLKSDQLFTEVIKTSADINMNTVVTKTTSFNPASNIEVDLKQDKNPIQSTSAQGDELQTSGNILKSDKKEDDDLDIPAYIRKKNKNI